MVVLSMVVAEEGKAADSARSRVRRGEKEEEGERSKSYSGRVGEKEAVESKEAVEATEGLEVEKIETGSSRVEEGKDEDDDDEEEEEEEVELESEGVVQLDELGFASEPFCWFSMAGVGPPAPPPDSLPPPPSSIPSPPFPFPPFPS